MMRFLVGGVSKFDIASRATGGNIGEGKEGTEGDDKCNKGGDPEDADKDAGSDKDYYIRKASEDSRADERHEEKLGDDGEDFCDYV